jgi:hypothetical protein
MPATAAGVSHPRQHFADVGLDRVKASKATARQKAQTSDKWTGSDCDPLAAGRGVCDEKWRGALMCYQAALRLPRSTCDESAMSPPAVQAFGAPQSWPLTY